MDDLFDPMQKLELALLRTEHQNRYQLQINLIKEMIGEGIEYENAVVRIVVSDEGAYYELKDLPEEFSGGVSEKITRHFLSQKEAVTLLSRVFDARKRITVKNTRQFVLMVIYTRTGVIDRKNCYIYDLRRGGEWNMDDKPFELGKFQPGVMPLLFKIKIDADFSEELVGFKRGIAYCMANAGDRHLLVKCPLDGEEITDLGALPMSQTIN
jgi:hypothetical protein